jgi:hypothetical protein
MIGEMDIQWKMIAHVALSNQYHARYYNKELGISKEVITKRTNGGNGIGKAKAYYFIDNDEREFLSVDDLIEAYNEKFKFSEENPEHEIKWIKVITKRNQT